LTNLTHLHPCHAAQTPPLFQAPEVLRGGRTTAASDVFAFGCVLWELLAWELPWGRQSPTMVGSV
jgi:serine/threonine protein kinase